MIKTTKKKFRKLISEELESAKDYSKRGFKSLAKDERKHAKFLKRKLNKQFKWRIKK